MMANGHKVGALIAAAAIGLVSCGGDEGAAVDPGADAAVAEAQTSAAPAASALVQSATDGSVIYSLNPAESEVYWRIYRAGALARLGHNHVISLVEFEGNVIVAPDVADSAWELSFPVDALVIDDPELRSRYGEDFESVPDEAAKEGTKTNMLTEGLLDGANFPVIRLEGSGVEGSLDAASLPVTISIVGQSIEQTFPASITITDDAVTVEGEYRLTHADLGLEPFSLMGGAMAVGDEIDFTYRLRADAVSQ